MSTHSVPQEENKTDGLSSPTIKKVPIENVTRVVRNTEFDKVGVKEVEYFTFIGCWWNVSPQIPRFMPQTV